MDTTHCPCGQLVYTVKVDDGERHLDIEPARIYHERDGARLPGYALIEHRLSCTVVKEYTRSVLSDRVKQLKEERRLLDEALEVANSVTGPNDRAAFLDSCQEFVTAKKPLTPRMRTTLKTIVARRAEA